MLSLLLYADDVAFIAPDAVSLQHMLDILDAWCQKWKLEINADKTKVVHFRTCSTERSDYQFKCGDSFILYSDCYRYLGIWLNEHLDMKKTVRELCKSAGRALSALYTKFCHAGGMSYDVYTKLYTTLVEPVLFYGSGIWGINKYKEVQYVQNKACKYFLGAGKNASNLATRGDMGWPSVTVTQRTEVCRLLLRMENMEENRIARLIHEWGKHQPKSWEKRVYKLLDQLGASEFLQCNSSNKKKLCDVKEVFIQSDSIEWRNDIWDDRNKPNGNKLRTYRLYKTEPELSEYVRTVKYRDHRRVLSKFRCGNLPLAIETGRYSKPPTPLSDRICQVCAETRNVATLEDETHFLIDCPFYSDIRYKLFTLAEKDFSNFSTMTSILKLKTLLTHVPLQPMLAATLNQMYKRKVS